MKRIIIVHRWSGGPEDDWRPWLKTELEKQGYEVLVPTMPDTDSPDIKKWVKHLAKVAGDPETYDYSETLFIGHSIGNQAIMRFVETLDQEVAGAIFVAGWFNLENLEDEESAAIAKPWIETPINLAKVRQNMAKSVLLISDNDPYDAFEENKKQFSKLGSKVVVMHKAGHITAYDGYSELPELLREVEKWGWK